MTNRVRTLTVVLEEDYREDDVELLQRAIAQLRGVHSCHKGPIVGLHDRIARMGARLKLYNGLKELLEDSE